ncbi:hypothetical protein COB57_05050 [Candidatus Peregrinibacteria bacterium]|nr:MAG: hypothetical protein COB57_05050 [Candidatus Peregrinibacteria bacterium]
MNKDLQKKILEMKKGDFLYFLNSELKHYAHSHEEHYYTSRIECVNDTKHIHKRYKMLCIPSETVFMNYQKYYYKNSDIDELGDEFDYQNIKSYIYQGSFFREAQVLEISEELFRHKREIMKCEREIQKVYTSGISGKTLNKPDEFRVRECMKRQEALIYTEREVITKDYQIHSYEEFVRGIVYFSIVYIKLVYPEEWDKYIDRYTEECAVSCDFEPLNMHFSMIEKYFMRGVSPLFLKSPDAYEMIDIYKKNIKNGVIYIYHYSNKNKKSLKNLQKKCELYPLKREAEYLKEFKQRNIQDIEFEISKGIDLELFYKYHIIPEDILEKEIRKGRHLIYIYKYQKLSYRLLRRAIYKRKYLSELSEYQNMPSDLKQKLYIQRYSLRFWPLICAGFSEIKDIFSDAYYKHFIVPEMNELKKAVQADFVKRGKSLTIKKARVYDGLNLSSMNDQDMRAICCQSGEKSFYQYFVNNKQKLILENNRERGFFAYSVRDNNKNVFEKIQNWKSPLSKNVADHMLWCGIIQMNWFDNMNDFLEYYYEINNFVINNYKELKQKEGLDINLSHPGDPEDLFLTNVADDNLHRVLKEFFEVNFAFIYNVEREKLFNDEDSDPLDDEGEWALFDRSSYLKLLMLEYLQINNSFSDIFIDIYLRKTGRWKYWKKKMNKETGPFRKWKKGDEAMYLGGWRDVFDRSAKKYSQMPSEDNKKFIFTSFKNEVRKRLHDFINGNLIDSIIDSEKDVLKYYEEKNI